MSTAPLAQLLGVRDRVPGGDPSAYRDAARWFDPFAGFNLVLPEIPIHAFAAERERALAAVVSETIALDLAPRLGLASPATTPAMLARYLRIGAGDRLRARWAATTVVVQVLAGAGSIDGLGPAPLRFAADDVIVAPAGDGLELASDAGCL